MGAWIETNITFGLQVIKTVAPYMGAWIETQYKTEGETSTLSHPTWVRGLKHRLYDGTGIDVSRTLHGCVD